MKNNKIPSENLNRPGRESSLVSTENPAVKEPKYEDTEVEEDSFEFGGIPNDAPDLKRLMGCGG
ncbi:MAG TPA: hypothetical protein DCE41_24920 [Cytophagales bacterium]|nr:hypothetical protein [Cytophagales bacterium]HAA23222.1 hypothetical protein [Cytophagales bacterium]HAP58490.1 hypothetical protein [Cytophagales bacterium]